MSMSMPQEAIGEVRMVDLRGQPKYGVRLNGEIIDAKISDEKPLKIHLGCLVRVSLRKGETPIITGVVKKK